MRRTCSVLLLSAPYATLTYILPEDVPEVCWLPGIRVVVPLGGGQRVGILTALDVPVDEGVSLREVSWPVEHRPLFSQSYLTFIEDLALRQMNAPGRILARVLPAGLRELPLFRGLDGQVLTCRDLADPAIRVQAIALFVAGGLHAVVSEPRREKMYSLAVEPPWPVRPNAVAQLDILKHLDLNGVSSTRELGVHLGRNLSGALRTLLEKGLVREVEAALQDDCGEREGVDFTLTAGQQEAVDSLWAMAQKSEPGSALLHGVTGSGKTAVYLELAGKVLASGRDVMLLAPEVAIALKLFGDARTMLPQASMHLYHGYLNPVERHRIFLQLARKNGPCLVVGTRSCLFLPIDPAVVVLDEEHDASFKQDEGIVYQARELAFGRVSRSGGLLVMGSATPDVKVFHAARSGHVAMLQLQERVGTSRLPDIELVDLRIQPPEHGPFATAVRDAIVDAVAAGDQVIILHNRRGYAPVLYCETCDEPVKCPHCQVSLTLHKRRELLLCHYCGYHLPFPVTCPTCKGCQFLPLGSGTERLEEFLAQDLPEDTKVLRLDRDTSRKAGAMQDTLSAFARGEAQVLVGTQMLSKGHHFPRVTLVVVVDGDLGLNLPDYRATERSFQLLVQVAGRAGRGERPGRVLIQTRNPGHYFWQFVRKNDYIGFFEQEIGLRRLMHYPPFIKLALVRLSMPVNEPETELLTAFARHIQTAGQTADVRVLGPAPAPLAVLRGRKRFQCLLKADSWPAIRGVCSLMQKWLSKNKNVRMSVDLDPVDML